MCFCDFCYKINIFICRLNVSGSVSLHCVVMMMTMMMMMMMMMSTLCTWVQKYQCRSNILEEGYWVVIWMDWILHLDGKTVACSGPALIKQYVRFGLSIKGVRREREKGLVKCGRLRTGGGEKDFVDIRKLVLFCYSIMCCRHSLRVLPK